MNNPVVTVLITTYNRSRLLARAISSVLKQDYSDFELIIIDDCSSDNTTDVVRQFVDPRIRYIRNERNQGAQFGDRVHLSRCVHELMRGQYFVYLCDDDYWLPSNLLSRQILAFREYPNLAMAVGGQADVLPALIRNLNGPAAIRYEVVKEVSPTTYFAANRFPPGFIPRRTFVQLFAEHPTSRNLVVGAVLFKRQNFIDGKIFAVADGSRWQAGYELLVGAGLTGDVFYIDEPCVIMTPDWGNASYQGTQLTHMEDCLKSVDIAFAHTLQQVTGADLAFFQERKREMTHRIVFHYAADRLGYRCGAYDNHIIGDMSHQFEPEIPESRFHQLIRERDLPLSPWNRLGLFLPRHGRYFAKLSVNFFCSAFHVYDLIRAYPENTVKELDSESRDQRSLRFTQNHWVRELGQGLTLDAVTTFVAAQREPFGIARHRLRACLFYGSYGGHMIVRTSFIIGRMGIHYLARRAIQCFNKAKRILLITAIRAGLVGRTLEEIGYPQIEKTPSPGGKRKDVI